ncbi:MAG: hypothetical protein WAK21_08315 [Candidatus Sulfotelmatobacter sp.]
MDSNDLVIPPVSERMESVPAVAPAQWELAAQNQQNQPRRHPPPDESLADEAAGESVSNAEPAPVDPGTSDSDKGADADTATESENERPPHRVDSLA